MSERPDEPTVERKCAICRRRAVTVDGRGDDQTCAPCVGEIRTHLHGIVTMSTAMLAVAAERGVDSEAAMLAGPAADPETWGYRRLSALAGRIDGAWLEDQDDEPHPSWTTGTWEMLAREHLDQPTTERLTLDAAVTYLADHLTGGGRLAHDSEFAIEEMAADVAACYRRLAAVLEIVERVERGAPCPECSDAEGQGRRLEKRYGTREADDKWVCPVDSAHWWDEGSYRLRVSADHLRFAEALTADQMHEAHKVKPGTLRKWVAEGRVHRRGYDGQRRQLYDVADTLAAKGEEVAA